jgi:hypothetical protein
MKKHNRNPVPASMLHDTAQSLLLLLQLLHTGLRLVTMYVLATDHPSHALPCSPFRHQGPTTLLTPPFCCCYGSCTKLPLASQA